MASKISGTSGFFPGLSMCINTCMQPVTKRSWDYKILTPIFELFSRLFHSVTVKFVPLCVPLDITSLNEEALCFNEIQLVFPSASFIPKQSRLKGVDQKLLSFVSSSFKLVPALSLYVSVLPQYAESYLKVCCVTKTTTAVCFIAFFIFFFYFFFLNI